MKFRKKKQQILNLLILGLLVSSNVNATEFNQKMTGTDEDNSYVQEGILEQTPTEAIYSFSPDDLILMIEDFRGGTDNVNLKASLFYSKNIRFNGNTNIQLEGYAGSEYNEFGDVSAASYISGLDQMSNKFALDGVMNIKIKSHGGIAETASDTNSVVMSEALAFGIGFSSLDEAQFNNELILDVESVAGKSIGSHENNRLLGGRVSSSTASV